ncbi:MAG: shikimate dehydrogenase [Deltaproteobacteria bacterium]|nr:shikimate dehydrogenase [Deltaproteobacteria bacterium]
MSAPTLLLGVLGSPIAHSASPAMQQAGLAAMGIDATYLPFEVQPEQLPAALEGLSALGALGANLTAPLKEAAARHLSRLEPTAARLGAVNTLVRAPQGRGRTGAAAGFVGHNTDLPAFEAALAPLLATDRPRRALVFGAGGTAATSLVALARCGFEEIVLLARTPERGQDLADRLQAADLLEKVSLEIGASGDHPAPAQVVVNATPLGRSGDRPAVPRRHLREARLVVDWVYRPGGTALIAAAAERGIATVDGAELLFAQGVRALALWAGREPGPKVERAMRRALHRWLESGPRSD